jgi:hypothetical protein
MCPSGVSRGDDDGQAVVAEFAFLIVHVERLLLLLQRMVYLATVMAMAFALSVYYGSNVADNVVGKLN